MYDMPSLRHLFMAAESRLEASPERAAGEEIVLAKGSKEDHPHQREDEEAHEGPQARGQEWQGVSLLQVSDHGAGC